MLGLFLRHWSVSRCISVFDALSRDFFGTHSGPAGGVWHYFRRLLRCWLSDGYYDPAPLEHTLRQHFGEDQRMFGAAPAGIRTRIGVTATTISDATPVVLSNYNGSGSRQPDCGEWCISTGRGRPRELTDPRLCACASSRCSRRAARVGGVRLTVRIS